MRFALLYTVAFMLTPAIAAAQAERPSQQAQPRVTRVSFDEDVLEAGRQTPDFAFIEAQARHRHQNLIRVRESFGDRIVRTLPAD
jgi:hypothetical protein